MFYYDIKTATGSTSLSAASSLTFVDLAGVTLNRKWHDKSNILLNVTSITSGDSGAVDINVKAKAYHEGPFTGFTTGSGSSIILTGGTSTSGILENGTYLIPLTIVPHSGVTELLKGGMIYALQFRRSARTTTSPIGMKLIVG